MGTKAFPRALTPLPSIVLKVLAMNTRHPQGPQSSQLPPPEALLCPLWLLVQPEHSAMLLASCQLKLYLVLSDILMPTSHIHR